MEDDKAKVFAERLHNQGNRIFQFQETFTYYILAIDAACIGFALNFTRDNFLSFLLIPVAIAIVCWGISFYCGICELQLTEQYHIIQYNFIEAQLNDVPEMRSKKFHDMVENDKKLKPFKRYKLIFLCYGVAAFICWDILNLIFHTTLSK